MKSRKDSSVSKADGKPTGKVSKLHVDLYQTEIMIVVYAQTSGAIIEDVHVSIEGEANIVLIEGKSERPEEAVFPDGKIRGRYVAEECHWGDFYRRIILPKSVNIDKAEAKIKNGVLILVLPLLKQEAHAKDGRSVKRPKI